MYYCAWANFSCRINNCTEVRPGLRVDNNRGVLGGHPAHQLPGHPVQECHRIRPHHPRQSRFVAIISKTNTVFIIIEILKDSETTTTILNLMNKWGLNG